MPSPSLAVICCWAFLRVGSLRCHCRLPSIAGRIFVTKLTASLSRHHMLLVSGRPSVSSRAFVTRPTYSSVILTSLDSLYLWSPPPSPDALYLRPLLCRWPPSTSGRSPVASRLRLPLVAIMGQFSPQREGTEPSREIGIYVRATETIMEP